MKNVNKKTSFYLASALFFSFIIASCSSPRSNEDIQQAVNDSLQANGTMKNIKAAVADGTVTLTGTCEGDDCVTQTGDKVKTIDGVTSVTNNVTMTPKNTDYTLRTQVQNIVTRYAGVQADVAGGVVVLRGSIDRGQLQSLMTELNSLQASKIDNQLALK